MHWPEKAQGRFTVSKFTINLQRIKSRSSEAMRRCWGKLRKGLITIETESSQEVIHMPGPFPPPPPHRCPGSQFSQCSVSQAEALWLRLSWCHPPEKGGRPLHQRKRHLTETHPPSGPLGSLTFPGQGKQTSFRKELCSQCGKEEEGESEKVNNVFTLGREPTTREVSVLSEKVSKS